MKTHPALFGGRVRVRGSGWVIKRALLFQSTVDRLSKTRTKHQKLRRLALCAFDEELPIVNVECRLNRIRVIQPA